MTEKQRRLTILDRAQIIEKLEAGEKEINLAKEYGVTQTTISRTKKKILFLANELLLSSTVVCPRKK